MTPHRILQLNGVSTAACAVLMLAMRGLLYPLFGLETPLVIDLLAIGFIAYAAALLAAARRRPVSRGALFVFTVADVAYVAVSVIALLVFWSEMTPLARWLIVATALIVEVFATLQFRAAGGQRRTATQMA
jgi:hypothetical protein